jgi:hypothetical protein
MSITVDRSRVAGFIERHETELMVQKASFLDRSWHEVPADNAKQYCDGLIKECQSVPSFSMCNANEMRVDTPQRTAPLNVIGAASTKPGTIIISEEKDDAQLTFITAISAFGDCTFPMLLSKNKLWT